MDLAQLQAFLTVADTRSFSKASEALFLTQPAVSKRIAALESLLSVRLFDRIGHRVHLTEAGRTLLPRARDMLQQWQNSRRALDNLSGEVSGELRVVTSHHIGLHRLPGVLKAFNKSYPEVDLQLAFTDSDSACRYVEHGDYDVGVVTLPAGGEAVLEKIPVWQDSLEVVVGHDHALAKHAHVDRSTLLSYPAVLPPKATYTRDRINAVFETDGQQLNVKLSLDNLETIKMLVSIGYGWSALPKTMLDHQLHRLTVGVNIARSLGLIRHRERTLSNAAKKFINCVQAFPSSP